MMIARCNDQQTERIGALERELNGAIVAYVRQPELAGLSDDQLAKLHALEEELGLTLLVYRSGPGR